MLEMTLGAIGGLGLFLYGMNLMADGLQKVAGDRLKDIIRRLTRNRFLAVLVGAFVTMIIQSSSATSVMVVSFVNAQLMTLVQAVGIIFGANIGTTITGQMVSLNLSQFAPIAIGIGLVMKTVAKKQSFREGADILIGFSILFIGMDFLKDALEPLKDSPAFVEWITNYGSIPVVGVLIGFVMTLALQSSAATIGVLIALAVNGVVPFATAIYIIFGDNIGTCTTALISSIGTSRRGKRVALIHLMFNIIGTVYFMIFLVPLLTSVVTSLDPTDVARQIANAHSLFNIVNVIVLFPFANLLVKLIYFMLPETEEEKAEKKQQKTSYLDPLLLKTPAIAYNNALYEIVDMASTAGKTLTTAITSVRNKDTKLMEKAFAYEKEVNQYERNIVSYLVDISQQESISATELKRVDYLLGCVHDIERVSDHAENIAEFTAESSNNWTLDEETLTELNHLYELTTSCFFDAITAISTGDDKVIQQVIDVERELDRLKVEVRDKYIQRMNKGIASAESGVFVMDLLSNLERITDHSRNITEAAIKTGSLVSL